MGFWGLPTQLPTSQLRQKIKHLLQVGAPARPASQLPKPKGLAYCFSYTEMSTLPMAGRVPWMAPEGSQLV